MQKMQKQLKLMDSVQRALTVWLGNKISMV